MKNEKPVFKWTAKECYQYLAEYKGICTPEMSLDALRAEVQKTKATQREHIREVLTQTVMLAEAQRKKAHEHHMRLHDAAETAMHCLLHVDATMTERIETAKVVAEAIGRPWPPYVLFNAFGQKVDGQEDRHGK